MNNDGWVKAKDPSTGKTFYANHITRQTQWDPPAGFVDPDAAPSSTFNSTARQASSGSSVNNNVRSFGGLGASGSTSAARNSRTNMLGGTGSSGMSSSVTGAGTTGPSSSSSVGIRNNSASTAGSGSNHQWEMMYDEASGRPFYVDHVRKITTWTRPDSYDDVRTATNTDSRSNTNSSMPTASKKKNMLGGTATGFGFIPSSNSAKSSASASSSSGATKAANSHSSSSYGKQVHNPPPTAHGAKQNLSSTAKFTPQPVHHHHHTPEDDDMSSKYYTKSGPDAIEHYDFTVVPIADRLRSCCPSCGVIFSISKRRHHCRLCGDVFCDACSSRKVLLPLDGPKFEKPVRVCDTCHAEVDKGNYFSMRRYITPLSLFDENIVVGGTTTGRRGSAGGGEEEGGKFITPENVAAALSSLSSDLDSLLLDPTEFSEKVIIPAHILVPAITRHLGLYDASVSDRAIRTISNLLALGNVVGDNSFANVMYTQPGAERIMDDVLSILERSGSRVSTLAAQEQAARALFYLTDGNVISTLLSTENTIDRTHYINKASFNGGEEEEEDWKSHQTAVEEFDVHRCLKNMLDHTTSSSSPSLQRWAAADIRNLISEDHRRACDAVTEAMTTGSNELRHDSFIPHLISSGGIMILSSLMGSDDGDTRAHVTAALSATIITAREIDTRLSVWKEAFGISRDNEEVCSDAAIIEAIVSSGACGLSLAQLLLSADDAVATMGCSFALSLVHPIITTPQGSELPCYHKFLSSGSGGINNIDTDEDGLSAYRKAAMDLAINDGVLTALIQLVKTPMGSKNRPVELQRSAMEVLAAVTLTLSYWDGRLKSAGSLIEGDEKWENLMMKLETVQHELEHEDVGEIVLKAYSSNSVHSINTTRDSSGSQLREAACLILGALASFSSDIATFLVTNRTLTGLLSVAADDGMVSKSALRGDWAPRHLAMLEASSSILVAGWKIIQKTSQEKSGSQDNNNSKIGGYDRYGNNASYSVNSAPLDLLLEALDAGVVPLVSRIVDSRNDYNDTSTACSGIRLKIACSHMIAALFGICQCDETNIGNVRLYEAIEVNASNWGQNMISSTVSLLESSSEESKQYMSHAQGSDGKLPILSLVQASLLALGSICGSSICSFSQRSILSADDEFPMQQIGHNEGKHEFSSQVQMASISACDVLTKNSFLSSTLVGVFGEGSVVPALRLASAMSENGPETVHADLARTGFLVPVTDMLREAVVAGDFLTFRSTLTIISSCGPYISASSGENSNIQSLHSCIELLSNVLSIEEVHDENDPKNDSLAALKMECIVAVEHLSSNSSLWNTIATTFVPRVSGYLFQNCEDDGETSSLLYATNVGSALRAIQRTISLPSNAQTVAYSGICDALCKIICRQKKKGLHAEETSEMGNGDIRSLALEMLHSLAPHITSTQGNIDDPPGLLQCGAVEASCSILSTHLSAHIENDNTRLALELLQWVTAEVDGASDQKRTAFASAFVDAVIGYPRVIQSLCATLLQLNYEESYKEEKKTDSLQPTIEPLYGPSLPLYSGQCGDFLRPLDAAISTLFTVAAYCTLSDATGSNIFWGEFFLEHVETLDGSKARYATIVAACALFLNTLLDEEKGICVPKDATKVDYYQTVSLQIVREKLLNGLCKCLEECDLASKGSDQDTLAFSQVLCHFNVPQTCLGMCSNPKTLDSAFQVLERLLSTFLDDTLVSICSHKQSLAILFELLSVESVDVDWVETKPERIRQLAAIILSTAATRGMLGATTSSLGLRSVAIASLSAACLMDEQDTGESIEEDLAGSGSSISTMCIRGLVGVLQSETKTDKDSQILMSSGEAQAISSSLGKKLSDLILARFVGHAEVHEEDSTSENENGEASVTETSEVLLLCALASNKEALPNLCANGGLEALSLVAAEGEEAAILALYEACKGDPSLVISVEGHLSVMQVLASMDSKLSTGVKQACINFLVALSKTKQGRVAICGAEELCNSCIHLSSKSIYSSVSRDDGIEGDDGESDKKEDFVKDNETLPKEEGPAGRSNENRDAIPLILSSLSFLTSIIPVKSAREKIFADKELQEDVQSLAVESQYFDLRNEAIKFLCTSARYVKNDVDHDVYSIESVISTFLSILGASKSLKNKPTSINGKNNVPTGINSSFEINQNLVHAGACSAIEGLLCYTSPERQSEIISTLIPLFITAVDYAVAPGKKAERKIRNSGLLVYNITSIFMQVLGGMEGQTMLRNLNLVCSMLKLMIVNPPQTLDGEISEEDKLYWEGALTQSLQCIAVLTHETYPCIDESSSWDGLISKAEISLIEKRKTNKFHRLTRGIVKQEPEPEVSPFRSSLEGFTSDTANSVRSISAQRIIDHLEACSC